MPCNKLPKRLFRYIIVVLCSLLLLVPVAGQAPIADSTFLNENQRILGYSGGLLAYVCYAKSTNTGRAAATVSITAASNANPVVFTSTAHGFDTHSLPLVIVSGGTGNWAAVNGSFPATVIDADTFSIAVNSTGFGAVAGTLVYRTTAPRTTIAEWAIQKLIYDTSNNLVWTGWLNGVRSYTSKCDDASTSGLQRQ